MAKTGSPVLVSTRLTLKGRAKVTEGFSSCTPPVLPALRPKEKAVDLPWYLGGLTMASGGSGHAAIIASIEVLLLIRRLGKICLLTARLPFKTEGLPRLAGTAALTWLMPRF